MANRIMGIDTEERFCVQHQEERIEAERRMGEYLEVVDRIYQHVKQHRPNILTALQKRASLKRALPR